MPNKKDQILDISLSLFMEKGFDATSISDILARLDIARGTLYYHFKSKEAIMDAIIERLVEQVLHKVTSVYQNAGLSPEQKMLAFFSSLNLTQVTGNQDMVDYFNQPQNALFNEKSNRLLIEKISPVLSQLIQEGMTQGIYQTDFPDETAELILVGIAGYIDADYQDFSQEERLRRFQAFLYNAGRMLQLSSDQLEAFQKELFNNSQK